LEAAFPPPFFLPSSFPFLSQSPIADSDKERTHRWIGCCDSGGSLPFSPFFPSSFTCRFLLYPCNCSLIIVLLSPVHPARTYPHTVFFTLPRLAVDLVFLAWPFAATTAFVSQLLARVYLDPLSVLQAVSASETASYRASTITRARRILTACRVLIVASRSWTLDCSSLYREET